MKAALALVVAIGALGFAGVTAAASIAPEASTSPAESSHRSRCHQRHSCPSDHATYRWRGLLCVHRFSDERNRTFKRRVVYGGRVYFCKR